MDLRLIVSIILNIVLVLIILKNLILVHGVVEIDNSGDKPRWLMLFTVPTEDIEKRKYVIFRVRDVSDLVRQNEQNNSDENHT